MEQPLISIIVPVYNAEPYLDNCLDSIAAQTWENLEVWLVDDGSTDASPALCDARAAADPRFHVLHQANAGVSAARNAALERATGRYLQFVDGDDYLPSTATERLVRTAGATGAAGAAHTAAADRESGKPAAAAVALCLLQYNDLLSGELCQLDRRNAAACTCADDHAVGLQLERLMGHHLLRLSGVDGADITDRHAFSAFDTFLRVNLVLGAHIVDGVGRTFQRTVMTAQTEGFDLIGHGSSILSFIYPLFYRIFCLLTNADFILWYIIYDMVIVPDALCVPPSACTERCQK